MACYIQGSENVEKNMLHFFIPILALFLCCVYMPSEAASQKPDGDRENGLLQSTDATPAATVDHLAAKSNDWREPSKKSEEKYVSAIREWLDSLKPFQRERARQILREEHPTMRALRTAIREKKLQLASMSFDHDTNPEILPILGKELEALRRTLRTKLDALAKRLRYEAGVSMGPLEGDGFWLAPQKENPRKKPNSDDNPHSNSQPVRPLALMR